MSAAIELRALLVRDGRLLLLRPAGSGAWELPGGAFDDEADDIDAAMDSLLRAIGIAIPDIAEAFLQTVYLPGAEGQTVLNLYAPGAWHGEPIVPSDLESGWFAPGSLAALEMEQGIRGAVLEAFGLAPPPDTDAAILAQVTGEAVPEAGDRHAAGLDVLRTLMGRDAAQAARGLQSRLGALADDIVDFALGEVWSQPALDRATRSLLVVAMVAALGRPDALRSHLDGALNHGVSPEQLVQTLRMVAVYAGFPAAVEAWPVLTEVLRARGIEPPGRPA